MIAVEDLVKHFEVHTRAPGAMAALRAVFRRERSTVRAVDGVSFTVAAGERVGVLGPNGAGKTTTLKMLSGLVHPTSGHVIVAGHAPRKREPAFLGRISLVLGQRQRLLWDLPATETFELHRVVYGVSRADFTATMRELDELLELGDVVRRPTRELSLGERMKCELAAALVHRPDVLFLDEPTIGLDVGMQLALRAFVQRYNTVHGATVVLTSHDMDDVTALCPRVILIGHGKVAYDGPLDALVRRVRPDKLVVLELARPVDAVDLASLGDVVSHTATKVVLRVDPQRMQESLATALAKLPLKDLTVENPPLEEVMAELFATDARGLPGASEP